MSKTLYEPISLIIVITAVVVAASVGIGYHVFSGKHDSPIEERAEDVLRATTGVDVDFSASSPEEVKAEEAPVVEAAK
jgi:hypothetical protein